MLDEMIVFLCECMTEIIHAGITAALHGNNMLDPKIRLNRWDFKSCICCRVVTKTNRVVFFELFCGPLLAEWPALEMQKPELSEELPW
jgi:hypothetical protein